MSAPAPYYQDDAVTLYHGSCLDVLAWLEADVLVTDPPYGIDGDLSNSYRSKVHPHLGARRINEKPAWDQTLDTRDKALAAWHDSATGGKPYAVFGSPARIDGAPPFKEFPLVWDKGAVGMGDTTHPWGRSYELIYVHGAGWQGRRGSSVLRVPYHSKMASDIGHPTPKPLGLMSLLIEHAPPGVIADPFSGSGSTLIAAKSLGRRAIGVEFEEKYCELAAGRLAQDVLDLGV